MSLEQNILIFLPNCPVPIDDNLKKISDGLELAITNHIRVGFVPAGFSLSFLSMAPLTPFVISLGSYLESVMSPIISSALAASSTIGTLPAWASVQPAIFALYNSPPPFMTGIFAVQFWQSILFTISASLPPPPTVDSSGDSSSRDEVLRVDT